MCIKSFNLWINIGGGGGGNDDIYYVESILERYLNYRNFILSRFFTIDKFFA